MNSIVDILLNPWVAGYIIASMLCTILAVTALSIGARAERKAEALRTQRKQEKQAEPTTEDE